jgi:hypothetical protein
MLASRIIDSMNLTDSRAKKSAETFVELDAIEPHRVERTINVYLPQNQRFLQVAEEGEREFPRAWMSRQRP